MIIIRMLGGLGNQLFIYAFGRILQINHNLDIYFDTYSGFKMDPYRRKFELDYFNTVLRKVSFYNSLFFPLNKRSKLISGFLFPNSNWIVEDDKFSIEILKEHSKRNKNIFLQGYFQKPEYFESISSVLRNELILRKAISKISTEYLEEIENHNSVAIHIRERERKMATAQNFYSNSIKKINGELKSPKFFIFSDDIEWAKVSLREHQNLVFVENTANQIEDFWLLRKCKHYIISESTFSWWALWLGKNADSIVYKLKQSL